MLGIPGGQNNRKRRTVHINIVKHYVQPEAAIIKVVLAAEDDSLDGEVPRLAGWKLDKNQQLMLDQV